MKKILIVLTVIQFIGVISSSVLSGNLTSGILDMQAGILLLAILWAVWGGVKFFRQSKLNTTNKEDKISQFDSKKQDKFFTTKFFSVKKIVIFALIILFSITYFWWFQKDEVYSDCLEWTTYNPEKNAWHWKREFLGEYFQTREQAVENCKEIWGEIKINS